MKLLVAYDGSDAAAATLHVAGALFAGAEAAITHVRPMSLSAAEFPSLDPPVLEGLAHLREDADEHARATLAAGVEQARAAGLQPTPIERCSPTPWRTLLAEADAREVDLIACGARGVGPLERALLGSTASSLIHHTGRPLLVVPGVDPPRDGPVLAGYDGSAGARAALRFAGEHLPERSVTVAHAWRSPVRHTVLGYAFMHSGVTVFEDFATTIDSVCRESADDVADQGARLALALGLRAHPRSVESAEGDAHGLLDCARMLGAAVILVGTRGGGALSTTVLGSVACGLVHAAEFPVLIVS